MSLGASSRRLGWRQYLQTSLASALGVHRNRVCHWEQGEAIIGLQAAMRVVGVLRCDLNCILPGSSFVWGRNCQSDLQFATRR